MSFARVRIDLTGVVRNKFKVLSFQGYAGTSSLWLCQCYCGSEPKIVPGYALQTGRIKSCGCAKKDARGPNKNVWKGGRYTKDGYRLILKPQHPNANKSGYIREHVYAMSEHLGRPLVKGKTVHHKNGVRDDNRLSNLELWSHSHPCGQRVKDKLAWAREMIALYDPPKTYDPLYATD